MKTLYPFQETAVARCVGGNMMIADECGLGKTLMAIETVRALGYQGPRLVICPNRVKEQWRLEIIEQFPGASVYVLGPAGRPPLDFKWDMVTPHSNVWVVTHYESLLHIWEQLVRVEWAVAIYDEAHRIKNRKAQTSMRAKYIKARRKIALSGTPMERTPADLWSVLNWLDMKKFSSYWAFVKAFVHVEVNEWIGYRKPMGAKDPEALAEYISPYYVHRTKREVAPELPPRIMQRVPVEMDPPQKRIYDQIAVAKDLEVEVESEGELSRLVIANTLGHILRLQQVSSDPLLLGFDVPSSKIQWLEDYIRDNPEEVMVVFTRFRNTAIRLGSILQAPVLVGGMRNPSVAGVDWFSGKKNILVGTIAAMGEGLNLQRASTAIFLDQEWSLTKMTQAIDRIHRINIEEPKNIIYLYSEGTTDQLILEALDQKWGTTRLVFKYLKEVQDVSGV